MHSRTINQLAAIVLLGLVAIAVPAHAATLPYEATLTFGIGGESFDLPSKIEDLGGGVLNYSGDTTVEDAYHLRWSLFGKADPAIAGFFAVENLSGVTQIYSLTMSQPVVPIVGSSVTGGSIAGSLSDGGIDGATLATAGGNPLYEALIDGSSFQTLYNDPTSFPLGAGVGSVAIPGIEFGTPIPSLIGPAVASTIGTKVNFSLTAGDVASFTFNFVALPVPEPSSMVLGLTAVAGLLAVRLARRS